jgi:hypothetical protein
MDTLSSPAGTYVYGVAPADAFRNGRPPLSVAGVGGSGAPVRTILLADLVAVVSDVPGSRIDLSRENLLDHQRVLDEVLSRSDVLPFSFGTVAASDDEVCEVLLRDAHDALRDELEYVRGCIELGVKVFWEEERLFAEIAQENDEVRALRDAVRRLPDETAAQDKVALGQLTESEIALKSEWEAEGILDVLEDHAIEMLVSPNLKDTMLLNAAFLVERDREPEFDRAVAGLAEAHGGRLIFNYVGPLPPYSFINLAFKAEG